MRRPIRSHRDFRTLRIAQLRSALPFFALLSCVASVADITVAPAPSWYRPIQCKLQESPQETLVKEPVYLGKPLYGAIHLGDGEDNVFCVAVDIAADWAAFTEAYRQAKGKVDMAQVPARIYVDMNNDENLTNDGPGVLSGCTESRQTAGQFTISAKARCRVRYADGARVLYPLALYMFPQRQSVRLSDGSEMNYGRTLFYYRAGSFQTRLPVGQARLSIRFFDENSDGLIAAEDNDQVAIDLNRDGVFEMNPKGPEIYSLDEPFSFDGKSWVLSTFGPRGDRPTVRESEQEAKAPVYILRGEAAPDFTMPTLDGATFTLSQQKGKVVVLDFWATWCGPCLQELPNVVKMWDDLKDDGLVLVGISLDRSVGNTPASEAVRQFVADKNMTWTHIVEGKYWNSEVASLYQVWSIPHTVLIGPDGKMIAVGLRGDRLHEAAKRALEQAKQSN